MLFIGLQITFQKKDKMAAIIVINTLKTNKVRLSNLFRDADNIFSNRGFISLSAYPRVYFNQVNVPNTSIEKAIKMLKASEFFPVVRDIYYTNNMKKTR